MSKKALFVQYCAKDFLEGTQNMDALTELAYRRICDMIYSTNDNLLDNDSLQYATKTGAKWKKIRKELIEVHKKITVENGYIRNAKCSKELQKSYKNIAQKITAGEASAAKRKALENNKTGSTAVTTDETTAEATNREPITISEKDNSKELSKKSEKPPDKIPDKFAEFWNIYPKQRAGSAKKARMAWNSALIEERATEEEIIDGARRYANSHEVARGFAKGAAAWLNDDRWTSDYSRRPVDAQAASGNTGYMAELEETAHRLMAEDAHPPDQH